MTIQTWDPNRVGGGTIELIQDPTTGIFTTNEVGFVKLPDLTLPEIDQAPYPTTPDDDDTDDDTTDPCPDGYKLVDGVCQVISTSDRDGGDGGGGGYGGGYGGVPLKTSTYRFGSTLFLITALCVRAIRVLKFLNVKGTPCCLKRAAMIGSFFIRTIIAF